MNTQASLLASLLLISSVTAAFAADDEQTLTTVAKPYKAPEFVLRTDDGKTYRLADYRGKVVVVNFWATWCPPCRQEMPSMDRAYKQLQKDGIEIVAVNVGENEDAIFAFTGVIPVSFPLLLDPEAKVVQQYRVRGLPTTYVVDPNGMVVYSAVGGREWDAPSIASTLRKLRAPQSTPTAKKQ